MIGCTYDLRQMAGVFPSSAATRRIAAATFRFPSVPDPADPSSASTVAALGSPGSGTEGKLNVATAMRLVAAELGNTPAICRKSYVHPIVVARYLDEGETITLSARYRQVTDEYAHSAEERALIRFLDRHFPERPARARRE